MKIIKPIAVTENIVTSNAPEDANTLWQEEGRDFSRDFGQCVIAASDTHVYTLNSSATSFTNSIKVQEISTGATEFLSLTGVNITPSSMIVSADNNFICLIGRVTPSSSNILQVYSLSTGLKVYERTDVSYAGNLGVGIQIGFKFSHDSSMLAFWAKPTPVVNPKNDSEPVIVIVSTVDFSETISDSTITDYRTDIGTVIGTLYNSTIDLIFDDADANIYGFGISTNGNAVDTKYILIKVTSSTGVSSGAIVTKNLTIMAYNATRSEIVAATSTSGFPIAVFLASTLVEQSNKPNLTGVVRNSYQRILHISSSNDLYVRDTSKAVGYVLYSMVDYSSSTLLDPTEELLIAHEVPSYYVTAESDGFGLFDIATVTEITSSNPSVIAGNVYQYSGKIYEVLTNNTDRPDVGTLLDPPTWLDLGVINPLRMFDGKLDSLTIAENALIVNITPDVILNSIAIFNIDATTIQITMTDPTEGLVYDSGEISLIDSGLITSWYEFFFNDRLQQYDVVKVDLPAYPAATTTITMLKDGEISVGEIVPGKRQVLGVAQYGSGVGIIDFSRKEQDQFGNFGITPRRFSKRAEYDVKINTGSNAGVQRILADYRTTPIVWIGDENKLETVVYGYYRNFDILIAGPTMSDCTITVEGL